MKTAIVLGGTVPHIELIRQLKERGYKTVLIDFLQNPPAKKSADIHIQESTLDKDKVYEIAKKLEADLVIATCIDHANSTACYVLEKLNKHYPYNYQVSLDVTDKCLMKEIMKKNNIPTSDFNVVSSTDNIGDISFPVVVKPVDSNGSRGIRKVDNILDLQICIKEALNRSKTSKAIIEKYVTGTEISVYSYILHGEAHIILMNQRHTILDKDSGAIPGFAASYPFIPSKEQFNKIKDITTRAAKAFKLENTPLLLQMILSNNEIYVLELMPRIGGGQSYWNIRNLTGFDMISAAIDSFEGKEPVIKYHEPEKYSVTNNIYTYSGVFDHVENGEKLIELGLADEFRILREKGSEVVADFSTGNRVCTFVVSGKDKEEVYSKIYTAINLIDILDNNGKSIMRKDIYLH